MLPQWHRGTQYAVDAARALHDEVAARAAAGEGPRERVRLMWVGRGLWFNMGFYQHFEERYGAVFVWSMYLAVAADAYLRYGDDPLRTLAARFAAFGDQINMPPWSSEWYLKEARHNRIDGVVHLVGDALPRRAVHHARARGGGHPRLRDHRAQRRPARVGRRGDQGAGVAVHRGARPVKPLEGIMVVDVTAALAGPYATFLLGALGARVIKVENPRGGDRVRNHPPFAGAAASRSRRERRPISRSRSSAAGAARRASRSTSSIPRARASSTTSSAAPTSSSRTSAAAPPTGSASATRRAARRTRGSSTARSAASAPRGRSGRTRPTTR